MPTDPDLPAAPSSKIAADLRDALRRVRSVGVITGAGISAESGIPTYRGVGGIYADPAEGDRTVEALSGPTLARDPDRTWRAVADLARRALNARPNAAHQALVAIEDAVPTFTLLTQNVDGLHRIAGSRNVIEIHGDVLDTRCTACEARGRLERETLAALEGTPRCPRCGGGLRPDAVLFDEMLPIAKVVALREAFYVNVPDLVLVVGTTALFPYISEPVHLAARAGRLTVEVNVGPTPLTTSVRHHLRGPASVWVPRIAAALGP